MDDIIVNVSSLKYFTILYSIDNNSTFKINLIKIHKIN